jgi:hypothetical protein
MIISSGQRRRKSTLHAIHFSLIELQSPAFRYAGGTERHVKKKYLDIVNSSIQNYKRRTQAYEAVRVQLVHHITGVAVEKTWLHELRIL